MTAELRSPRAYPIFGHIPLFRRDALAAFTYCAREFGDVVPLRFGPTTAYQISDPEVIEDVLVAQARNFKKDIGARMLARLAGQNLFTSDGDYWRRQRRMMQPSFIGSASRLTGRSWQRRPPRWPPTGAQGRSVTSSRR